MSDPTADAAKLNERVERALRHLPEIAEILDRDNDRPIVAEEARLAATLIRDLVAENPSPQPAPLASLTPISVVKNPHANAAVSEPIGSIETMPAPPASEKKWDSEAGCMGTGAYVDVVTAPPSGEPDFQGLASQAWKSDHGCGTVGFAAMFGERMYRLGQASRPKVEDADVATEMALIDGFLGGTHGTDKESFRLYMKRWRDLLERLAGDLVEYCNDWRALYEAIGLSRDETDAKRIADRIRELVSADAKLAEREAELAKADAVITVARSFVRADEEGKMDSPGSLQLKFERFAAAKHLLCDAVKQYDAARQQQKASAEPTTRERG